MQKGRWKIIVIGCVAIVLMICGSVFLAQYIKNSTIDNLNFSLTASETDSSGISTESKFTLLSEKDYTVSAIKKVLTIEPEIDYDLKKTSFGTYLITPDNELTDNLIYNVMINTNDGKPGLSWAFQTKTSFKVVSTIPTKDTMYAQPNTGIELYFSMPVVDIKDSFEILPKVSGNFEYKDKKVIFIPHKDLELDTPYQVTLKKECKDTNGQELKEDYVFNFRTAPYYDYKNYAYFNLLDGYQETLTTKNRHVIGISADDDLKNEKLFVDIFDLSNIETYLNVLAEHENNIKPVVGNVQDYMINTSKYSKISSFETNLKTLNKNTWKQYIILPENLNTGWYLADIKTEAGTEKTKNKHVQKLIQVSDLSVYMFSQNGEAKIWCNDSETGLPAKGATVSIGKLAAVTDKDGVAELNINSKNKEKILITADDGKQFAEYQYFSNKQEPALNDLYYTYLYTDRDDYLPTDTVKYWGKVIPKSTSSPMPKKIIIEWDEEDEVNVDENGTFSGEIKFSNHISSYFSINLKIGELSQFQKSIQIIDKVRPVYTISSRFNKGYYRAGEKISFTVNGTFYDGTSADGIKIAVNSNANGPKTLTLDNDGSASGSYIPGTENNMSGDMHNMYFDLKVEGIDEYASSYNNVQYFPTDYHLERTWKDGGNASTLNLRTSKVDYNAISETEYDYEKLYKGEPFGLNLTADIIKIETIKTQTGENYDYYEGVTKPEYKYDNKETFLETVNIEIPESGEVKLPLNYHTDENVSYKAILRYTFPDGFSGSTEVYLWEEYEMRNNDFLFSVDKSYLSIGDTVKVKLDKSDRKKFIKGKLMYIVSRENIKYVDVTETEMIEFKYNRDLVPNCLVSGAFFDGENIYEIQDETLYFDTKEKEVTIDIKTDRETYKPGDKVSAVISVKDSKGNPVQADIIAAVTDESTLESYPEESPLFYLYRHSYYDKRSFTSFIDHDAEEWGYGGGGGEGEGIRSAFIDTPTFESVSTDKNGVTEIAFILPDNLTSWRMTAIAITSDANAGIAKKNIKSTIPFFVNSVMNTKYTERDDVSLTVRTAGTAKSVLSSLVTYEARLVGDNVNKTKKLELKPSEVATFNFGKQPSGEYEVTIKASAGEYSDGILKKITVQNSLQEIPITKVIGIDEIKKIGVVKFPAKLILYDKANGMYFNSVNKVLKTSYAATSDQKIARNIADSKLNELNNNEMFFTDEELNIQGWDGGIGRITTASSDPLITAKICWVSPESISTGSAISYFNGILGNTNADNGSVSAAYFGLAALKQPVLTDIKYLLENNTGFNLDDNINLISGLATIGDYEGTLEYYEKLIKPRLTTEGTAKYIKSDDENLIYETTSKVLPILSVLRNEDFESVLNYILEKNVKDYSPAIDLCVYINLYDVAKDCKSGLSFKYGDKNENVDFSKVKAKTIELNEQDFKDFTIMKQKGDVRATVYYTGGITDVASDSDNSVKISKEISKTSGIGGYSTVTIKTTLPENRKKGYYLISDLIPSSSRYMSNNDFYNENWGLMNSEKQKMQFYIKDTSNRNITIQYKVRNILPGNFLTERAVVTDPDGMISGYSNETEININ